ncbi:hypothetical protein CDAR_196951 [Caerostris darwini]|uniref:Uncharacterized protein n=1 Tax=Caerostris darwini TaxID=1538125 RepID=A0AAV4UNJ6_9ARAC|nr:hypothetical protein CDAR_196951 [Caerostris darwini]
MKGGWRENRLKRFWEISGVGGWLWGRGGERRKLSSAAAGSPSSFSFRVEVLKERNREIFYSNSKTGIQEISGDLLRKDGRQEKRRQGVRVRQPPGRQAEKRRDLLSVINANEANAPVRDSSNEKR